MRNTNKTTLLTPLQKAHTCIDILLSLDSISDPRFPDDSMIRHLLTVGYRHKKIAKKLVEIGKADFVIFNLGSFKGLSPRFVTRLGNYIDFCRDKKRAKEYIRNWLYKNSQSATSVDTTRARCYGALRPIAPDWESQAFGSRGSVIAYQGGRPGSRHS